MAARSNISFCSLKYILWPPKNILQWNLVALKINANSSQIIVLQRDAVL